MSRNQWGDPCLGFRNSEGVVPVCFLKLRVKNEGELKPVLRATALADMSGCSRRSFSAIAIRPRTM